MAKRRKLEAPSAADLDKLEETFRRETPVGPGMAPIAQIASENAMNMDVVGVEKRKDNAELERYRAAEEDGLVARAIAIDEIEVSAITRDRLNLEPEAYDALKGSIEKNGLRMPIEVFEQEPGAAKRYGLISGFRRLRVIEEINKGQGGGAGTIDAFVRSRANDAKLTEVMIEENEIRANLSQYERARICVLSVQSGSDANLEAAVNRLFGFASKAKRSKIRSFAAIYETLGDVMAHGDKLKEKQGLALAAAIRDGAANRLREALATHETVSAEDEWAVISDVISPPRKKVGSEKNNINQFVTGRGVPVKVISEPRGVTIQIGEPLSEAKTKDLIAYLKKLT